MWSWSWRSGGGGTWAAIQDCRTFKAANDTWDNKETRRQPKTRDVANLYKGLNTIKTEKLYIELLGLLSVCPLKSCSHYNNSNASVLSSIIIYLALAAQSSIHFSGSSDLNEEDYRSFLPSPGSGGQIQLWQFLLELLDCPDKFKEIIVWEGIFTPFIRSERLSRTASEGRISSVGPRRRRQEVGRQEIKEKYELR